MKIAIALSGGIDSAAAAALLKKEGHEVIGLTMQVTSAEDALKDAAAIARHLDIPHRVIDLREIFSEKIIADFCNSYRQGKTPNPCVKCNEIIKFGALREKAKEEGAEAIATGHYARIEKDAASNRLVLKKGIDNKRDQSYFLYGLTQAQLADIVFPLGHFTKDKVREMAKQFELPVTHKKESREICFIPDNDYPRFLREHLASGIAPGQILDKQGNLLGKHNGIIDYTIGQRKGLGISSPEPLYVISIDSANNAIVVGDRQDIYAAEFTVSELNWIAIDRLCSTAKLKGKIRYAHREAEAVVTPYSADEVLVRFTKPQMAVTPGQSAVFYDGDIVVGGGTIERMLH